MFRQSGCLTAPTLAADGIETAGASVGKGNQNESPNDKKHKERPGNEAPGLFYPSVTLGKAFSPPPLPPPLSSMQSCLESTCESQHKAWVLLLTQVLQHHWDMNKDSAWCFCSQARSAKHSVASPSTLEREGPSPLQGRRRERLLPLG